MASDVPLLGPTSAPLLQATRVSTPEPPPVISGPSEAPIVTPSKPEELDPSSTRREPDRAPDVIAPRNPDVLQDGNVRGTKATIDLGDGAEIDNVMNTIQAGAEILEAIMNAVSGSQVPKQAQGPRKSDPVEAGGGKVSGPSFTDLFERLAKAVVDLGQTWGNWQNTTETEFNFGHQKVDGELWGRDGDGDVTWADNGKKVSPDQVNAMPEPQRQEYFKQVGIEPVPERQVGTAPNPAVRTPPDGASEPGKQVLGGGEKVEPATLPTGQAGDDVQPRLDPGTGKAPESGKDDPEAAKAEPSAAKGEPAAAQAEPTSAQAEPAAANAEPAAAKAEPAAEPAAAQKPAPLPLGKKQTIRSVADPHITSADGLKYDNKLPGDFVLASSNKGNFDVQIRQGTLPGDSGVWQTAAAVKTDGHVVQYDGQRNVINIDGKDHPFKAGQRIPLSDGAYVQMSREANPGDGQTRAFDRVQVHTAQGDDVYMLNFARGANRQLDLRVDVAGTRLDGEVSGIGGRVDRDTIASNDLVMRDGSVTTNADAAANSWRLKAGESILP